MLRISDIDRAKSRRIIRSLYKPNAWLTIPVPTLVRDGEFRIRIYGPPREHPPAHVHVLKGHEASVIIRLGVNGEAPVVREVYDMKPRDVVHAYRLVQQHAALLMAAWEHMHG